MTVLPVDAVETREFENNLRQTFANTQVCIKTHHLMLQVDIVLIGVATGGQMGAAATPTVSRPGPEIIANSLRNFFGRGGRLGAITICMKIFAKNCIQIS